MKSYFEETDFKKVLCDDKTIRKFYDLKVPGTYSKIFLTEPNTRYIFPNRFEVEKFRKQNEALIREVTKHGTRLHLVYHSPAGIFEVLRIFQLNGQLRVFESFSSDPLFWPVGVARHIFLLS